MVFDWIVQGALGDRRSESPPSERDGRPGLAYNPLIDNDMPE